jgi:YfiH family protein
MEANPYGTTLSLAEHKTNPAVALHADCWIPQWPAPANVRALCTTRAGGVSQGPYASMNLGNHVADAPQAVAANRTLLGATMAARPVFLNQVHGTHMLDLAAESVDGQDADGAFTSQPGLACTVMVADCLPVLLCDTQGRAVAAVHAGWRGLAGEVVQGGQGVLEVIFKRFSALALVEPAQAATELIAWLGPCIGPQAFEVGPEVRAAFVGHAAQAASCFTPLSGGKWLADLPGLARQRLRALGVTGVYGNDSTAPWCTVANPSRFFSYRRDGVSGRMAASI